MVLWLKNLPANAEDEKDTTDSTPGLGRSIGIGNGILLQYSCLAIFFFFNLRIVNTVKKNKQTKQNMEKGNEAGYRILSSFLLGHPGLTKASFAGRHHALCHYIGM